MRIQCCVCRRVKWGTFWVRPWRSPGQASHTYCPRCARATRRELDRATSAPARWRPLTWLQNFQARTRVERPYADLSSDSTF